MIGSNTIPREFQITWAHIFEKWLQCFAKILRRVAWPVSVFHCSRNVRKEHHEATKGDRVDDFDRKTGRLDAILNSGHVSGRNLKNLFSVRILKKIEQWLYARVECNSRKIATFFLEGLRSPESGLLADSLNRLKTSPNLVSSSS